MPTSSNSARFISLNGTRAPASNICGTNNKGTDVSAARSVRTIEETNKASEVPVSAVRVIHNQ